MEIETWIVGHQEKQSFYRYINCASNSHDKINLYMMSARVHWKNSVGKMYVFCARTTVYYNG